MRKILLLNTKHNCNQLGLFVFTLPYHGCLDLVVCVAMLQEVIDAADGAAEEKNELEELKLLLPDIREKVEDAKESQRTASAASQAIQQTLVSAQALVLIYNHLHAFL